MASSQPAADVRLAENIAHLPDFVTLLHIVLLIDANAINPDQAWAS